MHPSSGLASLIPQRSLEHISPVWAQKNWQIKNLSWSKETLKSMALAGGLQQSAVLASSRISLIGFESLRFIRLALHPACRFLQRSPQRRVVVVFIDITVRRFSADEWAGLDGEPDLPGFLFDVGSSLRIGA